MAEEQVTVEGSCKLVVKNLPFEASVADVTKFFGIDEDALELPMRPDGDRCKGIAFLTLEKDEDIARVRKLNDSDFTVGENTRAIGITDFEARERRPRRNRNTRKPRRNNQRNNRDNRESSSNEAGNKPTYTQSEESQREVYVSNVAWKATQEDIEKHFSGCGEIELITIPKLYASGRPKGFAFVRFATTKGREAALELNDSELLDRKMGVRENKGRANNTQTRQRKEPRTGLSEKQDGCLTIYVGNLPWSTDEEELEKLFADCGKITNARIVRQSWTKKSRGFGYVEFEDTKSVDAAVKLKLTCEDRELRLDYAEQLQ